MKRCKKHLWQRALSTIKTILDLTPGAINYWIEAQREIHVCVHCGRIKETL